MFSQISSERRIARGNQGKLVSMISDPIGDMITRIRNGYQASRGEIKVPYSQFKERLADLLVREGYLKRTVVEKEKHRVLKITLKYRPGKKPAVTQIKRFSRPGKRVYTDYKNIPYALSGLGRVIISTPKGLMIGKEARKKKLGGEIICQVW